jgi:hypothetical protein
MRPKRAQFCVAVGAAIAERARGHAGGMGREVSDLRKKELRFTGGTGESVVARSAEKMKGILEAREQMNAVNIPISRFVSEDIRFPVSIFTP